MAQILAEPPKKQALLDDINELFDRPADWLAKPHDQLGGRKPSKLLESVEGRILLRDLIEAIKLGMTT
jgi:uncharacterized protein (DUF2384 family)